MAFYYPNKYILLTLFALCAASMQAQIIKYKWVDCNENECKVMDPYYVEGETLTWTGDCLDRRAHGYGTLTKYVNGEFESSYSGEYVKGIREASFGTYREKDKSVTTGSFVNGQLVGQGQKNYADGSIYKGEFLNYKPHGKGAKEFPSGTIFEGYFVSDNPYTGTYTGLYYEEQHIQRYKLVDSIVEEPSSGYNPEIGKELTEYFDSLWHRCPKEEASYYRIITYRAANKPKGEVRDYYITGELQSYFIAAYLDYDDDGKNFYESEARGFYKSGVLKQKKYYYNNKLNGVKTNYYEDGQVSEEITYDKGVQDGLYRAWYVSGKPKYVATFKQGILVDNKYTEYDENGQEAIVQNENFKAQESIWAAEHDGHTSYITGDNRVSLRNSGDLASTRFNTYYINENGDYAIEATFKKTEGVAYEPFGLSFGFKDWDNYYRFIITINGNFGVHALIDSQFVKICGWTKSDTIFTGYQRNVLRVTKKAQTFLFAINGQTVFETEARPLLGNGIGIVASGEGRVFLESLVIREFIAPE